ncbi:hypothetical protein [Zavarzinella formosa]|uniref:hypothetical protein n=1 Tax=Zavarzinella formosa TaxID=360055 RepID=UPI000316D6B7|nr:hypothetical protein [Zavarzinella formosa]
MTFQHMRFNQAQEVIVLDAKGEYECRGIIVGRSNSKLGITYDVMPNRAESMNKRMCGIPESRLRCMGKPILAYERKPETEARHILDEA